MLLVRFWFRLIFVSVKNCLKKIGFTNLSEKNLNKSVAKGILIVGLILIFVSEFFVYYAVRYKWTQIKSTSDESLRILFVADPHILGKVNHSAIARYDADRYLHKTFMHAFSFAKPNVLIFIGDLLDEGSIANQSDYMEYVKRFHEIYLVNSIQRIYIPGFRDIGGQNGTSPSPEVVKRFTQSFTENNILEFNKTYRFYKINNMLESYTNAASEQDAKRVRIGLSHATVVNRDGDSLQKLFKTLNPHVIFSANAHDSRLLIRAKFYPSLYTRHLYTSEVQHLNLTAFKWDMYSEMEIRIPTASPRMGKYFVGFGFAVFEGYQLRYTVLWQPIRDAFLLIYVYWLICVVGVIFALIIYKIRKGSANILVVR